MTLNSHFVKGTLLSFNGIYFININIRSDSFLKSVWSLNTVLSKIRYFLPSCIHFLISAFMTVAH